MAKPNSKFRKGSSAYEARQKQLAAILKRMGEKKRFDDLQTGVPA